MDDDLQRSVWQRVTAGKDRPPVRPPEVPRPEEALAELLAGTLALKVAYRQLRRAAPKQLSGPLQQMEEDVQGEVRLLRAEIFLQTGRRMAPQEPPAEAPGDLAHALRRQYHRERTRGEQAAVAGNQLPQSAPLLSDLENRSARRADTLRRLLSGMLY